MKSILQVSILLFWALNGVSQPTQFVLYGANPCTGAVERLNYFGLMKEGERYYVEDSSGVLNLKEPGIYSLVWVLAFMDESFLGRTYEISDQAMVSDTVNFYSVYSCLEPTTSTRFAGYCCCDAKCDGEVVEYFSNGNKRVEGKFEEGIPVGELKTYYPDGRLKQLDKYNKKGRLIRSVLYD